MTDRFGRLRRRISAERPVLIAGPTASGKSALALQIAAEQGRPVINADALQVFENWSVLTARPSEQEAALAPHLLYGHVPRDFLYSVGNWLREVKPLLDSDPPPIIVGGTGLYFAALTEGLADIPAVPAEIRAEAARRIEQEPLARMVAELDVRTRERIDSNNPMRVQRAWEVLRATGRGLADWQDETPPPLLPAADAERILLAPDRDWLADRIERRFDAMLADGALEEARANLPGWDPALPSAKAIGARELIAFLKGQMTLEEARESAVTATRQFARRQRKWFRVRMADWQVADLP